jgi:hypothetical protein
MYDKLLLHLFQIVSHSGFSTYITFAMCLDIHYVYIHSKSYISRQARMTYNLEWSTCDIQMTYIITGALAPGCPAPVACPDASPSPQPTKPWAGVMVKVPSLVLANWWNISTNHMCLSVDRKDDWYTPKWWQDACWSWWLGATLGEEEDMECNPMELKTKV